VNKNLLSFTQDDYLWQSICINQFPASRVSEERKNMFAKEATLRVQSTNESENRSDQNIFGTIISNLANLVLNTPSVTSNNDVTVSELSEWKRLYRRLCKSLAMFIPDILILLPKNGASSGWIAKREEEIITIGEPLKIRK
ncbi:15246_t:CDS:2, partial [Cetraspora pellucida]